MSIPTSAPSSRSRVRRLPEKAAYDRATIDAILDEGLVGHLGVVGDDGQPFVIPVGYARVGDHVIVHGSTGSRTFRSAAAGVPVCLTVTLLDGFVFARSVFNSSMNYRSVVILGVAGVVPDDEKIACLQELSERLSPGHWDAVRRPNAKELAATTVLRLSLDEAAAKVSAGPPEDEDEDYALTVWAGVVPLRAAVDAPAPDPRLAPETPVPAYVESWRPCASRTR